MKIFSYLNHDQKTFKKKKFTFINVILKVFLHFKQKRTFLMIIFQISIHEHLI